MQDSRARSRRPAGETRALMLEVALERVKADGLLLDYANIELEDLIRVAGVPRSTVFRIWPDRVSFVADLVRGIFEADPGFGTGFDGETMALLERAVSGNADAMRTADGRAAVLRDAVRTTVAHNIDAVDNTLAWRVYRTISAAFASGDAAPGGADIRALLADIVGQYLDRMALVYRELNGILGLRMREGLTERDLALAVVALIDGMSDHRRILPEFVDGPRPVQLGPEGVRDWHLAAIAAYGTYASFTESASA